MSDKRKLGVVVGGGPAPGINGVISAVTIAAHKNGWETIGFLEGYKHLAAGKPVTIDLTVSDVSRIHNTGGSILKSSRTNVSKDPKQLENVISGLLKLNITDLVSIGGDDTALTAARVAKQIREKTGRELRVVHVPKTIDNDLPLPEGIPTFGYQTARDLGAHLVRNLIVDARTLPRWFFVVAMGRKAGHLALGIGKAAAAAVTLIAEEFDLKVRLAAVSDILVGTIIKRLSWGKPYGVAVLAEGLMEYLDGEDIKIIKDVPRDHFGNILMSEVRFGDLVKKEVTRKLEELGIKMRIVDHVVGYELRCQDPNGFDIEYTRNLGNAAVEFLEGGGTDAIISIQDNRTVPIPFNKMFDTVSGKTEVRLVNLAGPEYQIARKYMIRLTPEDLEDAAKLAKLAKVTNLSPEQFKKRFQPVVS